MSTGPECPLPRPAGTMALPGDAAALRFYEDPESAACMVHDPHRQVLSVTVAVTHPAYVLLSPGDQQSRVSAWGRLLASLSKSGYCAAIQVLEATVPDPGTGVAGFYARHGTHDGGWADANYAALLAQSSHASSAHRTTITLALDMRKAAKAIKEAGRGVKGAAAVLRSQMEALDYSLRAAELHVDRWLDAASLAVVVRQAYDPAASLRPDSPGATLRSAGPVGVSEHWSYLRHDSGFSTVLWISEWPRQNVAPNFLHPVLFAQGVRRSLSLVARPLGANEALKQIRKEKTEAVTDSAQKAKVGQILDLSDAAGVRGRPRSRAVPHRRSRRRGVLRIPHGDAHRAETSSPPPSPRSNKQSASRRARPASSTDAKPKGSSSPRLPFARSVI